MITTTTAIGATIGFAGFATLGMGLLDLRRGPKTEPVDRYIASLDRDDFQPDDPEATDLFSRRLAQPFIERILQPAWGQVVRLSSAVMPSDQRIRMQAKLAQAGLDGTRRPEELIAFQGVGFILGVGLSALLLASGSFGQLLSLLMVALLVVGLTAAPTVWLSRKVDERLQAIRSELPDTLDLLAISVEAGVALEGAFQVVSERSDGPLAREIGRTLQEMGLGLSRHDALVNLKKRSQVPELSTFVQALIQADGLGMPLGHVLKVQAGEMRKKRRQWARERAAKLPVKILFPLVLCVFPAVLIVVIGPAMSQVGEALK